MARAASANDVWRAAEAATLDRNAATRTQNVADLHRLTAREEELAKEVLVRQEDISLTHALLGRALHRHKQAEKDLDDVHYQLRVAQEVVLRWSF